MYGLSYYYSLIKVACRSSINTIKIDDLINLNDLERRNGQAYSALIEIGSFERKLRQSG